jgi:hypothetical protein
VNQVRAFLVSRWCLKLDVIQSEVYRRNNCMYILVNKNTFPQIYMYMYTGIYIYVYVYMYMYMYIFI